MSKPLPIPDSLQWMRSDGSTSGWLDRLPQLVGDAANRWRLTVGDPYPGGAVSWVAPATTGAGETVVLKIRYTDQESAHEPAALRLWDGDGAVRLLDEDDSLDALLLEHCDPGHHLSTAPADEAVAVLGGLLERTTVLAGHPFTPVSVEAAVWLPALERHLARWPGCIDDRLLGPATRFIGDLAAGAADAGLLVHQDLHGDNVIAAQREPWLVIDPKPLLADRAFAVAPIVRSRELGRSRHAALRRLDQLSERLDLDRSAAARHTIAQTIAWAFTPEGPLPDHLEMAAWLLDEI